ncbi:hypothetical protein D1822_01875 [Phaeobacter inhibens]|nr:hypothetical protein D1822_01875 [Phaeobacter inhibens]
MPVLIIFLLLGVFGYFLWRHKTSSLSRHCRWRQERAADQWRCAACGAVQPGSAAPKLCLRQAG